MSPESRSGVGLEDRAEVDEAMSTIHPVLLTVPQAAAMLGIGRTTTYELISTGVLEVVHIGRATRVPVDAIYELVAQLREGDR